MGEDVEFAGIGGDDHAVDADVGGEEGVVADDFDGFADAGGGSIEADEPGFEVDAGVFKGSKGVVGDAAGAGFFDDVGAGKAGHAAAVVADDADIVDVEVIDSDEDGAHDRSEGVGNHGAGGFEDFDVALAEIHGLGEEFDKTGVHAGDDDDAFVGESAGGQRDVTLFADEFSIVFEDFLNDIGHRGKIIGEIRGRLNKRCARRRQFVDGSND